MWWGRALQCGFSVSLCGCVTYLCNGSVDCWWRRANDWVMTEVREEEVGGSWTWEGRDVWLMDFPCMPGSLWVASCWEGLRWGGGMAFFCSSCSICSNIPKPFISLSLSCRPASLSTSSSSVIISGVAEGTSVRGYILRESACSWALILFKAHQVSLALALLPSSPPPLALAA